jgi:hypothetical protein
VDGDARRADPPPPRPHPAGGGRRPVPGRRPERTELIRLKLERSPLLREAFERDNWHVLKWNHLRSFLARDEISLDALEPYLGLDPVVERSGEQLDLFGE